MKHIILSLFTIICFNSFSQNTKRVYIVDSNKIAISFVHINLPDGFFLVSDANGVFLINNEIDKNSVISLSHIAFKSKQIAAKNVMDTIYLKTKEYELDEIVISSVNLESILKGALKNTKYDNRLNYNSTRLIAHGDTLLFYNEKAFRLLKISDNQLKRKIVSTISYNVKTKKDFNINFPFSRTIHINPYKFYQSKSNLNELIKNAYLKQITDDFYKIESETDSTSIIMYVSRLNNKLLRFEKSIIPSIRDYKDIFVGETRYSFDFEVNSKEEIIIRSFKYEATVNRKIGTKITTGTMRFADILVKSNKIKDSFIFNTLEELKSYKQKQKVIDASLYPYFKKDEPLKKVNKTDSLARMEDAVIFEFPKFKINSYSKEFKQKLPKHNYYMALYNQATLSYDYYPSNTKVNFNLNSVNSNSKIPNLIKKDSFNPYGVSDPKSSIFMGVINTFLNKIQK